MSNNTPPFEITNRILSLVTEIAEQIGHLTSSTVLSGNPICAVSIVSEPFMVPLPLNKIP